MPGLLRNAQGSVVLNFFENFKEDLIPLGVIFGVLLLFLVGTFETLSWVESDRFSGKTAAVIGDGYSETWNNVDAEISKEGDLVIEGEGFEVRYGAGQWSRVTFLDFDPHAVNAIRAKEESK